ncbi:hypothetical protein [Pseudoalteromonas fuliginea]|uniref:hypothetical protein n=1 Tax=Pseudoalteromonas fuliginea TaxID=1872678 RepID=UPI003176F2A6
MDRKLYLSVSKKTEGDLSDFIGELHKFKIVDKYNVGIVSDPLYYFRGRFIDEVVRNGFNSMLNFSVAMDDITTPGMSVDETDLVFHKFVTKLMPIEKLIIVDPYFYPKKFEVDEVSAKFIRLLAPVFDNLKSLVVVSNSNNKSSQAEYNNKLLEVNPDLVVTNYISNDFHDRFWVNPENVKGIVVGTSINGIGKKISLVDTLSTADVEQILSELSSVFGN